MTSNTVDPQQTHYAPWWGGEPAKSVLPYWIASVCAVVAVMLLVTFWQVVRGSVSRGEMQRQAWIANGDTFRNCRANPDLAAVCGRSSNMPADAGSAQNIAIASQSD